MEYCPYEIQTLVVCVYVLFIQIDDDLSSSQGLRGDTKAVSCDSTCSKVAYTLERRPLAKPGLSVLALTSLLYG